jgi:hypothetical protein
LSEGVRRYRIEETPAVPRGPILDGEQEAKVVALHLGAAPSRDEILRSLALDGLNAVQVGRLSSNLAFSSPPHGSVYESDHFLQPDVLAGMTQLAHGLQKPLISVMRPDELDRQWFSGIFPSHCTAFVVRHVEPCVFKFLGRLG